MIPKIIHYCWFGKNPLPEMAQKCIASWKKYCPDYEIVEWNEDNFDVNSCAYAAEAYACKKWAFVSDVARLYALVTQGGIYMDTDVEVLKPLDDILNYQALSGFEAEDRIPTGLMACEKGNPFFSELLSEYDTARFIKPDGEMDLTTNVTRITDACLKHGLVLNNTLQTVHGFTLFPKDYFCPKDFETKIMEITENTYTIHHFDGSWLPEEERYALQIRPRLAKLMPKVLAGRVSIFVGVTKYKGFRAALKRTLRRIQEK